MSRFTVLAGSGVGEVRPVPESEPEDSRAIRAGSVARGAVAPPPSKSLTHRYFTLALLAGRSPAGRSLVVERPLDAEDTRLYMELLQAVGFGCERRTGPEGLEAVELTPPPGDPAAAGEPISLFCGNAGTLLRLVTAALATRPGRWRIDGTPRMRERPVAPLLASLRQWGVEVEELGTPGHPPVLVHGGRLAGGRVTVDAGASSQYLSALLLAALAAGAETSIEVTALTSSPYIDLSLMAAREFGGRIERDGDRFRAWPGLTAPARVRVEGDWSAACYPAAAAALTGGHMRLEGMRADSAQGDRGFLELLRRMGASVRAGARGIEVEGGGPLVAVDADLSTMPDQVPTLAALAPFAMGTTRIRGVPHLRIKESDRLRAMATELQRVGAHAQETDDGLIIEGVWAEQAPSDRPVETDSWNDHRIAMAMALVGLRRPGIRVGQPGVVGKSYPRFWDDFDSWLVDR